MSESINLLNDISSEWFSLMLWASVRGALAIIFLWTVCRAFRRIPPFVQCWLWRLSYVTPLIALFWLAPVEVPLLPASAEPAIAPRSVEMHASSSSSHDRPEAPAAESGVMPTINLSKEHPIESQREPRKVLSASAVRLNVTSWLLLSWAFGVVFFLLRLGRHWIEVRHLTQQLQLVTNESFELAIKRLSQLLGLRQRPDLMTLPANCCAPFLIGIHRPAIVLPSSMLKDSNDAELDMVFIHELSHLRRHDLIWNWLPRLVEIVFFFHPLVWLSRRQWRLTQEMAADELALSASGTSVEEYAHRLLAVVRNYPPSSTRGELVVAMSQSFNTLNRRLTAMKTYRPLSFSNTLLALVFVTSIGIVGVVPWKAKARAQPAETTASKDGLDRNVDLLTQGLADLSRERIPSYELKMAGGGDPEKASAELVAVLGNSRLKHWSFVSEVAFSPDGKLIASASGDGTVRLWDPHTGDEQLRLRGRPMWEGGSLQFACVAFSADGKKLAAGGWNNAVMIWDVKTGRELRVIQSDAPVKDVAFSADGRRIATGYELEARLWDASTGKLLHAFSAHDKSFRRKHTTEGVSVLFAPRDESLFVAHPDGTVRFWSTGTGKLLKTWKAHTSAINAMAVSRDGKLLATGERERLVKIWNLETGEALHTLQAHQGLVQAVAFHPDGKRLASGGLHGMVYYWDLESGRQRLSFRASQYVGVGSLSFSPDGQLLASAGMAVHLWRAATGLPRFEFSGHQVGINALAVSRDGRTLVTAGTDGTVKLGTPQPESCG